MVYDCLYKAVYNAVDRFVFFNKTGKTIAEWIDENVYDFMEKDYTTQQVINIARNLMA